MGPPQPGESDDSDATFPSFASAPAPVAAGSVVVHDPAAERRRRRRDRHERHRDDRHHKRRRRERHHDGESPGRGHRKAIEMRQQDDVWWQLAAEGVVAVDTRGDANLGQFQQSTRSAAPQFARRGRRLVVGLGRRLRIAEPAGAGDPEIRLVPVAVPLARYVDVDWAAVDRQTERVVAGSEPPVPQPMADHVAVAGDSQGRPPAAGASRYDSDDGRRPDFRSLDGMAVAAAPAVEAVADDGGAAEVGARTAALEARVGADRHDIGAWEALAEHQEAVVRAAFAGRGRSGRVRRTVAELRAEVLRRGLRHNPDAPALVLGHLRQRAELADDDALLAEWAAAADATADPRVVLHHVRFSQTLAARFSVPWMVGVYAASVRRVARCAVRAPPPARPAAAVALMELIHCACLFLREAGLAERALATYQAAVEWYVMTSPAVQQQPASHRLRAFRRFWDAGHPRVGMDGAAGWCSYGAAPAPAGPGSDAPCLAAGATTVAAWHALETQQAQTGLAPWPGPLHALTADQVDNADPFAVVVFEDVEPFLVDVDSKDAAARALVDRLLQFLGAVGPRSWVLTRPTQGLPTDELAWTVPGDGSELLPAGGGDGFPLVAVPVTLDTADTPLGHECTRVWRRARSDVYRAAAAAVLWQLRSAGVLDGRARQQLGVAALESAFLESPEHGRALGRRLLAAEPASLVLWNTLAKMHARVGQWAEARRVWAAALTLAATLPAAEHAWLPVLCKSWAVLEALHGRGLPAAIRIIATASDQADPAATDCCSPADILCARRAVDDYALATPDDAPAEVRLAVLTLRLWVAYAAQRDVGAVEAAFAEHSSSLAAEESALIAVCSVHLFHAKTARVVRAADLRGRVAAALRAFPHSTALWEMLRYGERRSPIAGRVARQLAAATADEPAPDLRMLAVYAARDPRPALRRATRAGDCASVLAWAAAIAFECRPEAPSPRRAKRLLLAALRACPWAKSLYLLAAGGPLAAHFSPREQHALLRAMVKAGIRTRASLAHLLLPADHPPHSPPAPSASCAAAAAG
ncbi:hypothetical protein IWQ57_000837 [Coemansia nantahalensis]|uniref:Uncharacterized protein n=1 Tax=Coemansia nantahalensis TaxID=2789366 RepID=A0ACC1K676_9FUNG|nr:hypothetical protein IWQ57_000837 [Coemansia nantahalensis]